MANILYYGDNLTILRNDIRDESVDLVFLDPSLVLEAIALTVPGGGVNATPSMWTTQNLGQLSRIILGFSVCRRDQKQE